MVETLKPEFAEAQLELELLIARSYQRMTNFVDFCYGQLIALAGERAEHSSQLTEALDLHCVACSRGNGRCQLLRMSRSGMEVGQSRPSTEIILDYHDRD